MRTTPAHCFHGQTIRIACESSKQRYRQQNTTTQDNNYNSPCNCTESPLYSLCSRTAKTPKKVMFQQQQFAGNRQVCPLHSDAVGLFPFFSQKGSKTLVEGRSTSSEPTTGRQNKRRERGMFALGTTLSITRISLSSFPESRHSPGWKLVCLSFQNHSQNHHTRYY